ncbi:MAG: mitochondrial fission ELM1 family protein [Gluconacetobacter diazotrophicus]|nr:mitochondrial fission ELM1 family protein [Gluconacetobacter diazotrophicus]
MSGIDPAGTPSGWVLGLDTGRRGEFAQVELLGRALHRPFRSLRLRPDGTLAEEPPADPDPPAALISFGKAAAAALALAGRWSPRPVLVQLGTPGHAATRHFDLVLPMPQDDYPAAPNVLRLVLPLNGARPDADALPVRRHGPDGTVAVIGGRSRHMRLGERQLRDMLRFGARLAAANGEALRLVASPRTPPELAALLPELAAEHDAAVANDMGAFPALLERGARFLVSADSASMLADTCRTGAPVWLWQLPPRPDPMRLLQESCDRLPGGRHLRHRLVARGRLGGGTDFGHWHRVLAQRDLVRPAADGPDAALRWLPPAGRPDTDLAACRARILSMLDGPAAPPETGTA